MAHLKRKHSFWSAEILVTMREAGYVQPTLLQQRLVPLILKGKDVAVEAEGGSGKTAAFILPLIIKMRRGKSGIKAVVLTPNQESSRKLDRELRRFSTQHPSFFILGCNEPRKELKALSKKPNVLVGTPNLVIDHIRRGNLHFRNLQTVVIDKPGSETSEFSDDVLFIYSKFPSDRQTILFSPTFEGRSDPLLALLKRPVLLPTSVWRDSAPRKLFFIEVSGNRGEERIVLIPRLILARNPSSLLVLCTKANTVREIVAVLKIWQIQSQGLIEEYSEQTQIRVCKAFSVGKIPILASTFAAAHKNKLRWVSTVINLAPPPDNFAPQSFVLQEMITLGTREDYKHLQENVTVQTKKIDPPTDNDVLKGSIERMLKIIKDLEDPSELNRIRSLVRRQVPFTLRSYFTAYLLKSSLKLKGTGKTTRLFVSAGRNQRIFAKDLIALFSSALNLDRGHVGEVKVLDNYSFIVIPEEHAERAIKNLSGTELKGRRLNVNYARKKEER